MSLSTSDRRFLIQLAEAVLYGGQGFTGFAKDTLKSMRESLEAEDAAESTKARYREEYTE